jgi:endonuclease YncB( thermonuclease family)
MIDQARVQDAVALVGGSRGTTVTKQSASNQLKIIHVDQPEGPPPGQAARGRVAIVDGDTLKYEGETIRLVDIDTPESFRSRCEHELVLALEAKARLRQLVDAGPLTIERTGKDRYGRTLARVLVAGREVGDTLLREGKALRYRPGQAHKLARLQQWCGPNAQLEDKWNERTAPN